MLAGYRTGLYLGGSAYANLGLKVYKESLETFFAS